MKNRKLWISIFAGIMAAILLMSLLITLLPTPANAASSSSEIRDQINELEKQNEEMQAQIDALKEKQEQNISEIEAALVQKGLIEEEIGLLGAQIDNMNEQIAAYNVLIADKQEELEEAEARLAQLNEENKERIRAMEEDGELSYWSVLFQANSFMDLLDRLSMVDEIAQADQRRLEEMNAVAERIETAKAELLAEREQMQQVKDELDATQTVLEERKLDVEELMAQLIAKGQEFEEIMSSKEEELSGIEEEIAQMESEFDKAVYQEHLATATTAPVYSSGGSNAGLGVAGTPVVGSDGETWLSPCDYRKVSSPFGMRIHPVYHDWRMHNGVDLDADCLINSDGTTDSPIVASRSGVVVISTYNSSAGWYVTIDHLDGYKSVYMHMCCQPFVSVGDVVSAGQVIGCIGTTGTSTGDHLHFGISYNGTYVNPMEYIG